ncbi:MAG: hypothetical protein KatS3mg100_648 [Candidatus Parcubacteria bacterium]|nr:MAG: hypothetical protein KatS3mg100_648 [Candidatus Parcubacteria bacterium]
MSLEEGGPSLVLLLLSALFSGLTLGLLRVFAARSAAQGALGGPRGAARVERAQGRQPPSHFTAFGECFGERCAFCALGKLDGGCRGGNAGNLSYCCVW